MMLGQDGQMEPTPCAVCPKEHAGLKDQDLEGLAQELFETYREIMVFGPTEAQRQDHAFRRWICDIDEWVRSYTRIKQANENSNQMAEATGNLLTSVSRGQK